MRRINVLPGWLRAHWFLLAATLVVLSDVYLLHQPQGVPPRLLELGLLADLSIVVPGLYIACYWRRGKPALMRAVALAALGFWSASKLLPESGQFLIPSLWPVRTLALAVLLLVELKVMLSVYRSVFGGASREEAARRLTSDAGMPAWAARVAAAEAAFWRAVVMRLQALLKRWRG